MGKRGAPRDEIKHLQVQAMLMQGMTQSEIAQELGVSRQYINQMLPAEVRAAAPRRYGGARQRRADAVCREAVRRIEAGETVGGIAADYGMAPATLYMHLRNRNLKASPVRRWTDDLLAECQRRIREDKEPMAEVAASAGTTAKNLNNRLVRWRRSRGAAKPRYADWPHIQRRWNEGATLAEIAAELGCTPGNVSNRIALMRSKGIKLARRKERVA